jgi:alanine dehydrogenase
MVVGVPKEVKVGEQRIALTPAGARAFSEAGHRVLAETGARSRGILR